ncbi:TolC family protein [Paraburkholderia humisilvae]|uniref:Protein CyaE n=1 Tax=Paraburkholderia humisilvae TaxID=627669 RepID=A0A6J5CZ35_9BURK|nr:TolC family protein [Paraburkholderia humisilvae]CAB3746095.1 Outer membrane protein OprM [Paraburkholderia humisilvae]
MSGRILLTISASLLVTVTTPLTAGAFDVFRTEGGIPPTAGGSIVPSPAFCQFGTPGNPLQLHEAVERALCDNPKTRQAWADVKAQAAAVGVARAAYLPNITGNWQGVRDDSVTDVENHPNLSSASLSTIRTESVSLTWTLYDFGARSAALANAVALLEGARATQDATLQTTFIDVTKDYYAAQAASGALTAARDVERMANDSLMAAQVRVEKGMAPISDALQAQTAHEQAEINVIKSEGTLQTALGTLANDMDLLPNSPIVLPAVDTGTQPDEAFSDSIDDLIELTRRTHPSVLAAQSKLDAAESKVAQTRAEGLPTFSLVSKYSRNNQPASLGLGITEFPATGREWYVGFQLSIPFFEGFGRIYQVRQAEAQVELQRETVNEARQQAALDVWTAYQALRTSMDTLKKDAALLDIAQRSFFVSQRRYKGGVGNILELLSAQTTLANAEQQRIQGLTDWRAARLHLAGSLGRLGFDDLSEH